MQAIPYSFLADDMTHFWVHIALCSAGFLLAIITIAVQWSAPAPYGKHETPSANWGPQVPQRLSHMFSDAASGVLMVLLVFFLYGDQRGAVNLTLLCLFEVHCIHRGLLHPLVMRYRNSTVALGICLGTIFPNFLYHYLTAEFLGFAKFPDTYLYDPRFVLGVLIFCFGFVVNRWADLKLRALRSKHQREPRSLPESSPQPPPPSDEGPVESSATENSDLNASSDHARHYRIPHGGFFELISCPNYFGEMVQWLGWALATFSLSGLVWWCFACATFIPRSRHNHQWYRMRFEDYPRKRRALIPFLF